MRPRSPGRFAAFGNRWPGAIVVMLVALPLAGNDARRYPLTSEGAHCTSDAMIVLDASGSMLASDFPEGAPNRMLRVQAALSQVLPEVARMRRIGLIVYGPGQHDNSCRNVELKFKPSPDAGRKIIDIAERIRPFGRTALSRSVELAVDVLRNGPQPAEIVVLTDGEDTCGGDPCQSARRIKAEFAKLKIHVIGFRLPSNSEKSGARCLAEVTGGKFVAAESTDELSEALRQTLTCAEISMLSPARLHAVGRH